MLQRLRDPSAPLPPVLPVKSVTSVSVQCDLPAPVSRAKRSGGPPSRSMMARRPLIPRSPNVAQPVSSQSDISVPSPSSSITVIDDEEITGHKENVVPVRAPPVGGLQAVMRRHRLQSSLRTSGQSITTPAAESVATTTVSDTIQNNRPVTTSAPGLVTNLTTFIDLTGDDSDDNVRTGAANITSTAILPQYHYRGSKSNVILPNPPAPPLNLEDHPASTELPWSPRPVPSLYLSNRKIDGQDVDDYYSLVASAKRPSTSSTGNSIAPCPKPSFAAELDVDDLYGDLGSLDSKPVLTPVKMPRLDSALQPGPSGLSRPISAPVTTGVLGLILTSDEDDDTPLPSILSSLSGPAVSLNDRPKGKKRPSSLSASAEDPTVRKRTNIRRRPM